MIRSSCHPALAILTVAFGTVGCRSTPKVDPHSEHLTPASAPRSESSNQLGFGDLRSALFDDWRPTGAAAIRLRWTVPLSVADLAELRALVESGCRLDAPPAGMFITAEQGVLHTVRGDYELVVGDEKVAARTYRASCRPVGAPEGREEVHLRWSQDAGEQLMAALRSKLVANAAQACRTGYVSRRQ
jgi:hypothetical protein